MNFVLTIWESSKRYVSAAIGGVIVSALAMIGVDAAMSPELTGVIPAFVDQLQLLIFYVVTILLKNWQQKRVIEKGGVLAERIESANTAREHGVAVKTPGLP